VPDPRGFPLHVSSGSFRGLTRAPPPNSFGRNMPAMIASSAHERCRHHRGARRPTADRGAGMSWRPMTSIGGIQLSRSATDPMSKITTRSSRRSISPSTRAAKRTRSSRRRRQTKTLYCSGRPNALASLRIARSRFAFAMSYDRI